MHMLIKQKSPSLPRNLPLKCKVLNSVFKSESATPPLFTEQEVLSSESDKAKLFAKNFPKSSNLDDLGISLPVFPFRTNLKLHNISVTNKMVIRVITILDSSKVSGLLHKNLNLMEFQVRHLALFLLFFQ